MIMIIIDYVVIMIMTITIVIMITMIITIILRKKNNQAGFPNFPSFGAGASR